MRFKYLFVTIVALAVIAGCNNEDYFLDGDDFLVSQDKAELIAKRVVKSLPDNDFGDELIVDLQNKADQGEVIVKKTFIIDDKNGKPAFYIVNFENGGFVILSADIRMGPVLSISEIGYFDVNDDYPKGLDNWLRSMKENIDFIRVGNYEADEHLRQSWEYLLSDEQDEITTRRGSKNILEYLKIMEFKHIMHLKWNHHGEGYNDSVPRNCTNNPSGKAYAGCVPVTVGQILRHWKYPTSYEWDKMPTSYATPTTAKFLVDIGKDVEVYYTCNSGSGSYMDIGYALRTFYGYNATTDYTYTYEELKNEIDNNRPVVLSGPADLHDGNRINHAWICEGFMEYEIGLNPQFSTDSISKENIDKLRNMLYMNWGWNEYNGWYSNEKLINGAGKFRIEEMIKNIYPRDL